MTIKEAQELIFNNTPMEIIYDTVKTPDFIEFKGECGGDLMRYRVYNDGTIYEK